MEVSISCFPVTKAETTAIPDLRGLPEAAVVEYYGGNPPVLRRDGKQDREIGKSVPLEVVESLNLIKKIIQNGKLVQPLDLKIVDFGQGKLTTAVSF
jgi:hypothetical protein